MPGTAIRDAVCADGRKTPPQGDARRFGEPSPDGRHAQSRCPRTVRQPEDHRGSDIYRAILPQGQAKLAGSAEYLHLLSSDFLKPSLCKFDIESFEAKYCVRTARRGVVPLSTSNFEDVI